MTHPLNSTENAPAAMPSRNQAPRAIPVLPEQHDPRYAAAHAAVESAQKTKRKSRGLVIGLSIASAVLIAVILALLAYIFKPFGLFQDQIDVSQPSQFQVQDAFESSDVPYPAVSHFKYVNTSNLKMASIDQFESTEVDHGRSHGEPTATSEGRAVAHYRNGYINVDQQLALIMSYDVKENAWVAGSPIEESIVATPDDIADVEAIEKDAVEILRSNNEALAAVYEGASVTSDAVLDIDGGTVALTLTKEQEDGSTKTCTASATVKWEQDSGWNVTVTEVTGDTDIPQPEEESEDQAEGAEKAPQQPTLNEEQSSPATDGQGDSDQEATDSSKSDPYDGATLSLKCYTGDLVEIVGTIQFDQSGHILLKTDQRIAVSLDETLYITDYFEVTGTSFTNGQHLAIIGYISATGKMEQAPLMIDANI